MSVAAEVPYLVSARKYRPQTFDTVIGQEHITTTLKNAIRQGKLAHAYLFCGPRGVGKTTCARILARTINCEHPTPDMEACGVCETCRALNDNASFNVFELDAASNNSVDDIRELVAGVRFAPQQGKYKIYIIDEVHMLSSQAFNAFLKTLEEPPPYAIFILATTEKHKILPTILSRCQIFDFRRIRTEDTVAHLQGILTQEGRQAEEAALHLIAQKSEGCMRDALSMLDRIAAFSGGRLSYTATLDHLAILDADFYFRLTDYLLCGDVAGVIVALNDTLDKGFEGAVILNGLAEHLRNLLLCKDPRMTHLLDMPPAQKKQFHEKALQAPPSFILSALAVLNDAEVHHKEATNKRLHAELAVIRLCHLLQELPANIHPGNSLGQSAPASDEQSVKKKPDAVAPALSSMPPAPPVAQAPAASTPLDIPAVVQELADLPNPPATLQPVHLPEPPAPMLVQEPPAPVNGLQPRKENPPAQDKANRQDQGSTNGYAPSNDAPTTLQQDSNNAPTRLQQPSNNPPTTSSNRRVSKDILAALDAGMADSAPCPEKLLSEADIQDAHQAFLERLKTSDRQFVAVQFAYTKAEWLPPNEVHYVAPTEMSHTCLRELRNELMDFLKTHTGCALRLTLEKREDPILSEQEATRVLSKPELFAELVKLNPNLARLKDGLNLQLDF